MRPFVASLILSIYGTFTELSFKTSSLGLGNPRTVDISKGNQFCLCKHIEVYAGNVFAKLDEDNFLLGKTANEMPERLTYYLIGSHKVLINSSS